MRAVGAGGLRAEGIKTFSVHAVLAALGVSSNAVPPPLDVRAAEIAIAGYEQSADGGTAISSALKGIEDRLGAIRCEPEDSAATTIGVAT